MMNWPPDIADELPAPRDDEPASLRQDIADELADHLSSAFTRELHLTRDESAAKANALDRFGDPRTIARKLWLDAMSEKIMSKRMTIVALLLVVLVTFGSTGMTWFLIDQARDANRMMLQQSNETNAALLAESRKGNEQMLERLEVLAASVNAPAKSMEWNPLKVRLFAEKAGRAPAAGFEVRISGHLLDTAKEMTLARTTGADGFADFGQVRPGRHTMTIKTPWGESSNGRSITVLPGEPQTVEAVTPPLLEETDISLAVDWPTDLASRGLWLVCDFIRPPRDINGQRWTRDADGGNQCVAVTPSGTIVTFDNASLQRFLQRSPDNSQQGFGFEPSQFFNPGLLRSDNGIGIYRLQGGLEVVYVGLPPIAPVSQFRWPAGNYRVNHMLIAREPSTRDDVSSDELLTPLCVVGINFDAGDDPKANWSLIDPHIFGTNFRVKNKTLAERVDTPKFEAAPGRLNEWRLSLPEPLVKSAGEKLLKVTAGK